MAEAFLNASWDNALSGWSCDKQIEKLRNTITQPYRTFADMAGRLVYYLFKRLLAANPVMLVVAVIVFLLSRLTRGDPAPLIAVEPTTALNVTTQSQILTLIKEMQDRRGAGVLFITHDLRVAAQICDRLIMMNKGGVVEQGPTAQVIANPAHEYTQLLPEAAPGTDAQFGAGAVPVEAG